MCARPRRISDEEIFAATMRAMSRLPPSELTLAAIGGEAGVTAGALVQRFGSKRALILALARQGAESEEKMADQLDRKSTRLNSSHESTSRMPSSA